MSDDPRAVIEVMHLLTLIEQSARGAREKMCLSNEMMRNRSKVAVATPGAVDGLAGRAGNLNGAVVRQEAGFVQAAQQMGQHGGADLNNVLVLAQRLGTLTGALREQEKPNGD